MRLRPLLLLASVLVLIGWFAFQLELALPGRAPDLNNTYTPLTQAAPAGFGSYDVLGHVVEPEAAATLLQTTAGQKQLSLDSGAVAVTQQLWELGRNAFYTETFGNEVFFTDVTGILAGPIHLGNLTRAIAALGGKPTTNLQIPLDQEVTIGDRTFPAGTLLNTGLDVPAGSLIPLGMQVHLKQGKVKVGITCAACHATINPKTGRILEGAPNNDINTGLLMAFATNSAAMFRQTGVNPTEFSAGDRHFIDAAGRETTLPDAQAVENAVDAQLLTWAPGNFDSTGDLHNNPSQIPSSYTHKAWPYGWSGFSTVGWFHGLTTLNNNVHATNSDPTTGADASQPLLGIDKETYLGIILQNAANPRFRLPQQARPSLFFDEVDPTPGNPGLNQVIKMPGYPLGSNFILDGLLANSPGYPVAQQLNGMSVFQNTLAPPPHRGSQDMGELQRGAAVFTSAGCVSCHSDRYFTNHDVISEAEIQSQPSRARALAKFPRIFHPPQTYPPNTPVPLPAVPAVLEVPRDSAPKRVQDIAYAVGHPEGGYKVPSLIGLEVTAPYLHDGGVAASSEALTLNEAGDRFTVQDASQIGLAGTSLQGIQPDPANSLRVLLDRQLRQAAIAANQANRDLQQSNADGSGHRYWVDADAGFSLEDQTALIQFLLSLDDDPAVLPTSLSNPPLQALNP